MFCMWWLTLCGCTAHSIAIDNQGALQIVLIVFDLIGFADLQLIRIFLFVVFAAGTRWPARVCIQAVRFQFDQFVLNVVYFDIGIQL